MSISLIITLYPPHFKYIEGLIKNIECFTLRPREVIMSVSEYDDTFPAVRSDSLKIVLLPTSIKQNASQNRNRALRIATGDYVCMADGDDLIHVRKLELCSDIFKAHPHMNLLVHSYDIFNTRPWNYNKHLDTSTTELDECSVHPNSTNLLIQRKKGRFHHAHAFFKRSVFEKVQYQENIVVGEDGLFCQDVVRTFGNVYRLNLNLIGYRHNVSDNPWECPVLPKRVYDVKTLRFKWI